MYSEECTGFLNCLSLRAFANKVKMYTFALCCLLRKQAAMKFPCGISDFYKIITEVYLYIDRTDRIPLVWLAFACRGPGAPQQASKVTYYCAVKRSRLLLWLLPCCLLKLFHLFL
jgi:hypothetical protein